MERALRRKWAIEVQIEIVRTSGDEGPSRTGVFNLGSRKAGRKGIFTAELERALVEKWIDVAVHSAKDIPSEMDGALMIAAVLPRADVEDLLLRKGDASTPLTTIATGSVRRQRQTRAINPEVRIVPLRGNVPTRLRKFIESDWDAIILARAGLERLGFRLRNLNSRVTEFLRKFCPLKASYPQVARASSLCKLGRRIFRCVRLCHLLMIVRRVCVCGPSESSFDYCRVIAICR